VTRLTAASGTALPAIDVESAARYYTHVRDMAVLAAEIEYAVSRVIARDNPATSAIVPGILVAHG